MRSIWYRKVPDNTATSDSLVRFMVLKQFNLSFHSGHYDEESTSLALQCDLFRWITESQCHQTSYWYFLNHFLARTKCTCLFTIIFNLDITCIAFCIMRNNDSSDATYYDLFEDIKIHVQIIMPHKLCDKKLKSFK